MSSKPGTTKRKENYECENCGAKSSKPGTCCGKPTRRIAREDRVRRLAHEIYENRGRMPGYEIEDWLEAERKIRQNYDEA